MIEIYIVPINIDYNNRRIGPQAQSRGHKANVFNNLDIVIGILTSLCCHKTPYGNIVFMFKSLLSSSNSDGGGLVGASLVE